MHFELTFYMNTISDEYHTLHIRINQYIMLSFDQCTNKIQKLITDLKALNV